MTHIWRHLLAALLALLALPAAHAAINCTIAAPTVALFYNSNTTSSVQTSFSVTCSRLSTDPTSVTYTVGADDGNYSTAPPANRARAVFIIFPFYLRYDFYTNASCATAWDSPRTISDTITWPAGQTGSITKQTNFWSCMPSQTVQYAATYTDTVTLTLTYGTRTSTADAAVNITTPASCTFTTPPGNIAMTYAAFGPQVANSTSFAIRCTAGMPYTISTDVTEGVLSGVRYVLSTSATTGNGTGNPQTYSVTATAPAGQAGQCSTGTCTNTNSHTLTISY